MYVEEKTRQYCNPTALWSLDERRSGRREK